MFLQDAPPGICFAARARDALGTPSLHQSLAVRLLLEAHLHHVDAHVETKHRAREGERRTPLPGAGLGREPPDAGFLVIKGLSHGGVRLVAASWAHPFIFIVDL